MKKIKQERLDRANLSNIEIGNIMFNENNIQKYKCPEWIIALLDYLDNELDRVMWNINQKKFDSPFDNTANTFETNVFKVQAYDWNDEVNQQYNFIYYVDKSKANIDDIKISWYKYLGRDTTINEDLDASIIIDMFNNCLQSIREYEKVKMREKLGI